MHASQKQHNSAIAFGPKVAPNGLLGPPPTGGSPYPTPIVFPPVGFVPEREGFGAGEKKTSKPVRISHGEYFSISVAHFGTAVVPLYTGTYQELLSHDGVDGSNGEFLNPVWGPEKLWAPVGSTAAFDNYGVSPNTTEAILVLYENQGGLITPSLPAPGDPQGVGVQVRVHYWS